MTNFTNNSLQGLSLTQLKEIYNKKKKVIQKNYKELREKERLIRNIKKLDKLNNKVKSGEDIKKKKDKRVNKKKIKTFKDYFEECIKNKKIPKDTPSYLRKSLERAIKEHKQEAKQKINLEKSALDKFANKHIIEGEPAITPMKYFESKITILKKFLRDHRNTKVRFVLVCMMEKKEGDIKFSIKVNDKAYFNSDTYINLESTDVKVILRKSIIDILEKLYGFQLSGSGWYFKEVIQLEIHTTKFDPMKGSSCIPLPDWIMRKKAIVSIRNKDNKCFIWSILRYLHPREKNDCRLKDLEQYEDELNIPKGFTFPVKIKDISKFETVNPQIPGINVFSINNNNYFYPLRMATGDAQKTIDLFLYEENGKSHYCLIKNFSRLFRSQLTSRTNEPIQICKRCFCYFTKPELLDKHIEYCSNNKTALVKMPKTNTSLYFKNYYKQLPVPFVIYADFECFTKPMSSCSPNPKDSYNYNYQKHEPSGFCFYVKSIVPKIHIKPIMFTQTSENDKIAKIFIEKLEEVTKGIYNDFYKNPKPLRLNGAEQKSFLEATICHICSRELGEDRVRDHCHFTGKYRGAAHNGCNLQCRKLMVLPVIFHNLQGYDAHLFIKQLYRLEGDLECIPSTEEKYISFNKKIKVDEFCKKGKMENLTFEIRFIDSFKFLQTSLANLVSNLTPDDFHNTHHAFKSNTGLLTRKGVYPYDYVSSLDKLSETQLPPKEEFYSKLNDEDITDDDYQHAINVWNTFGCKSIRDYHNLYLKSDVLLLADVFENFRATCLKHYKLDPVHYYTSPGLAWDACLETTGQHLQLLHDYDMLMMFERGIRGGITHISKRYAVANNKYMKGYNPDEESSYIQYLDANNLYGWAMSQNLPTHGFKWMKNITKETLMEILEKANHSMSNLGRKGYIFEVDLEYPQHLWEKHNDYPLAPEKMIVNGVEKLICHFKPRKNYVVHYRNLRQYLELGMRITAVHRGISFYQSSWMEPYIRKNTELRMKAANNFEKDFFKLMNNSVFGKTIENIRKRQNIHLIDNRKKAVKLSSKPNFDRCTIFDRNLIAVHMKNTEVYFGKPVYVGQAILDLSKTLMFDFHYNYIKKKYGNKAELLFTDTDSLMYQIKTKDFYKDICPDVRNKFDTSDYPSVHPSGIITGANKKVIGMFKDEVAGKQITHFVGLRPKLYSFRIEEDKEVRKCKGIKKNVIKKKLDFDDYVQCLFTGRREMRKMNIIRSEKHEIYSKEVNKVALSNEDDKRTTLFGKLKTEALR